MSSPHFSPRTTDHPPLRKRRLSTLDEQEDNVPPESDNKRLRRDLFGKDEKSSSLLGLGGDAKEIASFSAIKSPFREAMLYTSGQSPISFRLLRGPPSNIVLSRHGTKKFFESRMSYKKIVTSI
jgi:hypothetical protein